MKQTKNYFQIQKYPKCQWNFSNSLQCLATACDSLFWRAIGTVDRKGLWRERLLRREPLVARVECESLDREPTWHELRAHRPARQPALRAQRRIVRAHLDRRLPSRCRSSWTWARRDAEWRQAHAKQIRLETLKRRAQKKLLEHLEDVQHHQYQKLEYTIFFWFFSKIKLN